MPDKLVRVDLTSANILAQLCDMMGCSLKEGVKRAILELEKKVKSEKKDR